MPTDDNKLTNEEWVHKKIKWYAKEQPRYQKYANILKVILEQAASRYAPLAIIQVRAKTTSSYAEKLQRKIDKYRLTDSRGRPLHPLTDLCGARIITHTHSQVKAICKFVENNFDVDWANSVDVATRLKTNEFGYLSVHYITQLKYGAFPTKEIPIRIPKTLYGLCAEVQVRTLLEHAWADIGHDLLYKNTFKKIPEKWERDFVRLAAILEEADEDFSRLESGLTAYGASYGTYMTQEQIQNEIARLDIVLEVDPNNMNVAHRIAKLAMCSGNWAKAVKVLKAFTDSDFAPVLRDLGVSMCRLYKKGGRNFRQGQKYLEQAVALDPTDSDAIASLGGTWKGIDEEKAVAQYRRAFEVNPNDPYPLGNYLEYEIIKRQDFSIISLATPILKNAIEKCRDQADVGINMPWAFYDMGKFYLLLKKPYNSLNMYTKAVDVSSTVGMIETSLKSIERLHVVRKEIPGLEWVRDFLILAVSAKSRAKKALQRVKMQASKRYKPIKGPVVIVAGGCDVRAEEQIRGYRPLLLTAFEGFDGTIVSGGTIAGVSGLVGDLGEAYPQQIVTIGYVPQNADEDNDKRRYREIRRTDGKDFSPVESLQSWIDIISSNLPITQVKLLGIGGGSIATTEYRFALALGAKVAIIKDSGGTADELLMDEDWKSSKKLLRLPADAMTIRAFIDFGVHRLHGPIREAIAQTVHEFYQRVRAIHLKSFDKSMVDWNKLPEYLKESNRQQADYLFHALKLLGYNASKAKKHNRISLIRFSESEIETLAKMEHGRWNVERLFDGWTFSQNKDISRKISPYLVGWEELPEGVKELDLQMANAIPEMFAKVGMKICPQGQEIET